MSDKANLDASQSVAESTLTKKQDAVEATKVKLEEKQVALKIAQAAVEEVKAAQKEEEASFSAVSNDKATYETAMRDSFVPLKDGTLDTPSSGDQRIDGLLSLCKAIGLDESLTNAFPAAAGKKLDARGAFDNMVFKQLEDELLKHIQVLGEKSSAGAPAAGERMVAVQTAQAGLDAATEEQQESNAALVAAKGEHREAEGALKVAQKAVRDFALEQRTVETERDAALARLADFRQGPLTALRSLSEEDPSAHCVADEAKTIEAKVEQDVVATPDHVVAPLGA